MANFNHWSAIAAALPKETSALVRKTAYDIVAGYQATVKRDTGFAADSAYVVTSQESTYGQAGTPPGDSYLLPQVDAPTDDQTAYAAVGANYALFLEMGTTRMPAQPAWIPAVEAERVTFDAAIAAIESKLKA